MVIFIKFVFSKSLGGRKWGEAEAPITPVVPCLEIDYKQPVAYKDPTAVPPNKSFHEDETRRILSFVF